MNSKEKYLLAEKVLQEAKKSLPGKLYVHKLVNMENTEPLDFLTKQGVFDKTNNYYLYSFPHPASIKTKTPFCINLFSDEEVKGRGKYVTVWAHSIPQEIMRKRKIKKAGEELSDVSKPYFSTSGMFGGTAGVCKFKKLYDIDIQLQSSFFPLIMLPIAAWLYENFQIQIEDKSSPIKASIIRFKRAEFYFIPVEIFMKKKDYIYTMVVD